MPYSDESYNLRIELDTKHCDLSADEIAKMESALDPLARVVRDFPVRDLYVTVIHHPRSKDFHVKTALVLPSRTLFTGDRDYQMYPAYERCVRKLVNKMEAYKTQLEKSSEISKHEKGTHQDVMPTQIPDVELLQKAVRDADYRQFRRATYVYEESVRKRVGRWVQRYPDINKRLGGTLDVVGDVTEEVFLNAFEQFDDRPQALRFGDWLENLIDPSIKTLIHNPEELENVSMARTLQEIEGEETD